MAQRTRTALRYAFAIWSAGFVWGSVVFRGPRPSMTPPASEASRQTSRSACPILLFWIPLTWWLARRWLAQEPARRRAGIRLGWCFAGTNFALDLLLLVGLFGSGLDYFAAATVWLGYALLASIPALAGRRPAA